MLRSWRRFWVFVGALVFFGYKIIAGWLLMNLSASLDVERRRGQEGEDDHLVVNVTLEKGKVDGARLLGVEMRLSPAENIKAPTILHQPNVFRLLRNDSGRIDWERVNEKNKYLTLAPEEKIEMAEYFRVPPGMVYRIDLVVTADRFRDRVLPSLSQWRSSAIVLPVKATSTSPPNQAAAGDGRNQAAPERPNR